MTRFSVRRYKQTVADELAARGIPAPLARAYAARGIQRIADLAQDLKELAAPALLKNCLEAGEILADAIEANKKITIIGDYDCDGATATSVAILGLAMFGTANVHFLIPDRDKDGYGLSASLVDRAHRLGTELIITVDNGISALEAVEKANELGIDVLITDHHLAPEKLPKALCIVNPNQPGDHFPSKFLAGVGVIFYVLMATRAALRQRGFFSTRKEPNLISLTDIVALGTVADVVPLDKNNRILVGKGIERIRAGKMRPGIAALLTFSKRNSCSVTGTDLAFALAPRINAAGRLADISAGVMCLISPEQARAHQFAAQLEQLNQERREKEKLMQEDAIEQIGAIDIEEAKAIAIFSEDWHPGIAGLIASRICERSYRPVIAFAPSAEPGCAHQIKGSGRSIAGVHLRDALALVTKKHPGLIVKFGGHAQAAGLTIEKDRFEEFKIAFEEAVEAIALPGAFEETLATDGELTAGDFTYELASAIRNQLWGAGFPEPVFINEFKVLKQDVLKGQHLRLTLETDGRKLAAIWFRHNKTLPDTARLAYRLAINEWQGRSTLQLVIEAVEDPAEDWSA